MAPSPADAGGAPSVLGGGVEGGRGGGVEGGGGVRMYVMTLIASTHYKVSVNRIPQEVG